VRFFVSTNRLYEGKTMTKYIAAFAILCAALLVAVSENQAGDDAKLKNAKCPVSGKAIDPDASVEYRGAKVYFCCNNCPKAFEANTKKFSAKANQQLVITGQAQEVKCPFTGNNLNPETKINVQGANVCFCCMNCQAKAEKAEGAEQINLIFNDKAFDKGFKVKAQK
jgi:YHS domain-containing protein